MKLALILAAGLAAAGTLALTVGCSHREDGPMNRADNAKAIASTIGADSKSGPTETATFAAGCFWGVEAAFRRVEGVTATRVGYTGGDFENPTYEDVCSHRTGHAEAVEVAYDGEQVSYEELLEVFWNTHDPTQHNRQGPDVGSQYRSAIFYHDDAQRAAAEASMQARHEKLRRPIATQIVPAETFWVAEDYHQQYYQKRGIAGCPI